MQMHWMIGQVRITRFVEIADVRFACSQLFPHVSMDSLHRHSWLMPQFVTDQGDLRINYQAFVVDTGNIRILVDTCNGNSKVRPGSPFDNLSTRFLEELAGSGYPPESIDFVICTHMHPDHVGWNTRMMGTRWVPTFPNARYLFDSSEWAYWSSGNAQQLLGDYIADSIAPVFRAGLVDLVQPHHRICNQVFLQPTPGHTPGHVCIRIRTDAGEAVITGDMIQSPLQCALPELSSLFCIDQVQSSRVRVDALKEWHDRHVLVIGSHFNDPTAGYLVQDGAGYRLA